MRINVSRKLTKSVEKYEGTTEILKIYLHVENVGGLGGQNNEERGQTGGKICMKINVSRIQPNPRKSTRLQVRF